MFCGHIKEGTPPSFSHDQSALPAHTALAAGGCVSVHVRLGLSIMSKSALLSS